MVVVVGDHSMTRYCMEVEENYAELKMEQLEQQVGELEVEGVFCFLAFR